MALAKEKNLNQVYLPYSTCTTSKCRFNPWRNGILRNFELSSFQKVDLEILNSAQPTSASRLSSVPVFRGMIRHVFPFIPADTKRKSTGARQRRMSLWC